MSEKEFHNKISWFTFVYSLFVVWVHSFNAELFLGKTQDARTVAVLERILGNVIAQFAVPGFFMISAYLFYRNFSWQKLGSKWTSRIRSILIPFLVWNFLYYLGYAAASRIPFLDEVVGKGKIPFGLLPAVEATLHYTYNYVFWYLYQFDPAGFAGAFDLYFFEEKRVGDDGDDRSGSACRKWSGDPAAESGCIALLFRGCMGSAASQRHDRGEMEQKRKGQRVFGSWLLVWQRGQQIYWMEPDIWAELF